jgi:hypothetical protein
VNPGLKAQGKACAGKLLAGGGAFVYLNGRTERPELERYQLWAPAPHHQSTFSKLHFVCFCQDSAAKVRQALFAIEVPVVIT